MTSCPSSLPEVLCFNRREDPGRLLSTLIDLTPVSIPSPKGLRLSGEVHALYKASKKIFRGGPEAACDSPKPREFNKMLERHSLLIQTQQPTTP